MANVAVIGAGPMGLAACWELCKAGHNVSLYEADKVLGGMSSSINFEGLRIERFYHFICRTDHDYFELLDELGIADRLHWAPTKMGYFHCGKMVDWGNPIALLRFPGLGLMAKIRYGLLAFAAIRRNDWRTLDQRYAVEWLKGWVGEECYRVLWQPLMDWKFHQYADNLSAAWLWARLRRQGRSRRNLMVELLGYLEGGSDTFLDAIAVAIRGKGGEILTGQAVDEILVDNDRVAGVRIGDRTHNHDAVICTIPLPFVPRLLARLDEAILAKYRAVDNIAVVCVLVKLRRRFSEYFWLNISDPGIGIPGIVEFSNLFPLDGHVVYVPFYLPGEHQDYAKPDSWFIDRARDCLKTMNPDLSDADIIRLGAGRYRYAQPICTPGFLSDLPPLDAGVKALRVADTSCYYPEDRCISESVKLGKKLAQSLDL